MTLLTVLSRLRTNNPKGLCATLTIEGQAALENAFALPLGRAAQIRSQQQRQRGWKLYSFHAPEVECIGKGKGPPRPTSSG